mmetsp:Transcript_27743/g.82996  ORF Transcript_27743/g.82996 Transcript_27743/m.82996 type:complete len:486 (+) Transcript_27743:894-2351(+)
MSSKKPAEWWASTFAQAIVEIGTVVLVAAPWEQPVPLTRAWCLWEVYSAIVGKCTVHMEVPSGEAGRLEAAVAKVGGLAAALEARKGVSMEHAECTFEEDRDRIFDAVRRSDVGFEGVNAAVRGRLLGQLLCLGAHAADLDGSLACIKAGAAAVAGSVPAPDYAVTLPAPKQRKRGLFLGRKKGAAAAAAPTLAGGQKVRTRWRAGALALAIRLATAKQTSTPVRVKYAENLLDALVAAEGAVGGDGGGFELREMLGVSDSTGMQALHWACIGDGTAALPLARALVLVGASIMTGRNVDGATPLALLPAGAAQEELARAITESRLTAPTIRKATERFLSGKSTPARRKKGALATALLPVLARQAVAGGLCIGNTSRPMTDRRLACRNYVRAKSGIPLAAFVSKVTYTILRGSEGSELTESLIPRPEPPFDWDCFLWGYFDTTVTVYWKKETKLGAPVQHVHGIVWHDEHLPPKDRNSFAVVPVDL